MIQETIAQLEAQIDKADGVKPESKAELLHLLTTLRGEITTLSETHSEDAQRIAEFATVSTHEAMRRKKNARVLDLSQESLKSSVQEFEQSHPGLVRIVNRIC